MTYFIATILAALACCCFVKIFALYLLSVWYFNASCRRCFEQKFTDGGTLLRIQELLDLALEPLDAWSSSSAAC